MAKLMDFPSRHHQKEMKRELDMLGRLRHDNIVKFHGTATKKSKHDPSQKTVQAVLELCHSDLGRFLRKVGRGLNDPEIAFLMRQVLSAVDYLHAEKIILRLDD